MNRHRKRHFDDIELMLLKTHHFMSKSIPAIWSFSMNWIVLLIHLNAPLLIHQTKRPVWNDAFWNFKHRKCVAFMEWLCIWNKFLLSIQWIHYKSEWFHLASTHNLWLQNTRYKIQDTWNTIQILYPFQLLFIWSRSCFRQNILN